MAEALELVDGPAAVGLGSSVSRRGRLLAELVIGNAAIDDRERRDALRDRSSEMTDKGHKRASSHKCTRWSRSRPG